jgi:protein-tyrosine-phosphatase
MPPPYRNILIICHANTSRSIIAEELLKKMLRDHDVDCIVRSAGVAPYARDGALVSMDARLVLRDEGIHLSGNEVATDLKNKHHLVEEADLILAMTHEQIEILHSIIPAASGKEVYTLKAFAGADGDIEDPAGQDESVFAACRDEIKACLERAVERLVRTED